MLMDKWKKAIYQAVYHNDTSSCSVLVSGNQQS